MTAAQIMILTYKFDFYTDEVYEYECEPDLDDIIEYLLTEFVPKAHITPGCSRVIRDLYKAGIIERDLDAIYGDDEFIEWLTEYCRDTAYDEWIREKAEYDEMDEGDRQYDEYIAKCMEEEGE